MVKRIVEEIIAYGHPNVTSTHPTTIEFTKAAEIKKVADCIVAVRVNKACSDLSGEMKKALLSGKKVEITIEVGGVVDRVVATGSPNLKLTDSEDIVIRKSDFIDDRTLAINANKSACNLKKELVEKLRRNESEIKITILIPKKFKTTN